MADRPSEGRAPARKAPRLDTANIPQLFPTPQAQLSGGSPTLRSPSPGNLSASPEAGITIGGTVSSADFLSVRDPNTLSANEFVLHHNIGMLVRSSDRQTAAIERMAEQARFKSAAAVPKAGVYTPNDVKLSAGLLDNYSALVKATLQKYAEDLKGQKDTVTGNAGKKMFDQALVFKARLIDAAPLDDHDDPMDENAEPTHKRAEELLNSFSDDGVRVFYQNIVKMYMPNSKGKAKTGKAKTSKASKSKRAEESDEETQDQEAIFDLVLQDSYIDEINRRYQQFLKTLPKGPTYTKKAGLTQVKKFIDEGMDRPADDDVDMDEEDPLGVVREQLDMLKDDGLLLFWNFLGGKVNKDSLTSTAVEQVGAIEEPTKQALSAKAAGKRRANFDDGDAAAGPTKRTRGSTGSRRSRAVAESDDADLDA